MPPKGWRKPRERVKLKPDIDAEYTKVLNLTVLRRIDPSVEEILFTAAHISAYDLNIDIDDGQWKRKDVAGTMFLVKRNTLPTFQFIVLNRKNTENLVENISGWLNYEVQPPYIMYRNERGEVLGLWFCIVEECEAAGHLLSSILGTPYEGTECEEWVNKSFQKLETGVTLEEPSTSTNAGDSERSFADIINAAFNLNIGKESEPATTEGQQETPAATSAYFCTHSVGHQLPPSGLSSSNLMPVSESVGCSVNRVDGGLAALLNRSPPLPMARAFSTSTIPLGQISNPVATVLQPQHSPVPRFPPPPNPPSVLDKTFEPVITKEAVHEALLNLSKNEAFIDLVFQEILNS